MAFPFARAFGFLAAGWLVSAALFAEISLPPVFSDHAILQRDQPLNIWGWADPGENITVRLGAVSATAQANARGVWLAQLPPQPVSTQPLELLVDGKERVRRSDILLGDVWLCSGQSNMEMPVSTSLDAKKEIAVADYPQIREIKVKRHLADGPQEHFEATAWRTATPQHVADFTATGFYFARKVWQETGVPIGLIQSSWSGTSIEPWMSASTLASKPEFAVIHQRWQAAVTAYPSLRPVFEQKLAQWEKAEVEAAGKGEATHALFLKDHRRPLPPASAPDHPYPSNPSALFDGMVYPLRHVALRGVIWYQGEANAVRATEYAALFHAMIRNWRDTFARPELPFYWVQIANFSVDTDWPSLREAQSSALDLPHSGQAVTIDIGDPDNIHPANKQETGRRLALIALAKDYGKAGAFSGPVFVGATFAQHEATVRFDHAAGLHSLSGHVRSLELAGSDHRFVEAEGRIEGETLVVSSEKLRDPIAVRYAWSASPSANLYNLAGLPAAPFRSDSR